jgi:hypothetical protein
MHDSASPLTLRSTAEIDAQSQGILKIGQIGGYTFSNFVV